MFKPLSVWSYLVNNHRQAGAAFIVTCLSIVLQGIFLNYATSVIRTLEMTEVKPWTFLACIGCVNFSDQSRTKQQRLRQTFRHHPAVAKVLPSANASISSNQIASPTVFFIKVAEIPPLMAYLDLNLIHGRMPRPGSREIILHWALAANKNLRIGDSFGNEISKLEAFPGKVQVVGLFDGHTILGLADLESIIKDSRFSEADLDLLLIPKTGQLDRLKYYLTQLRQQDQAISDSSANEKDAWENVAIFNTLLNTVYGALTIIITLCASFLFFLYFYKRRPEFGLLEALGHTRKQIIVRVFREIAGINLVSFLLGVAVAFLTSWILNWVLLNKYGIPLVLWDSDYPGKLLPLPLMIICCSIIPVWRMLVKVEPLALIEGEE